MKTVGSVTRLVAIAAILALAAFVVAGCGSDTPKKDTTSVDQSQPTAATDSGDQGGQGDQGAAQPKQFEQGQTVGKSGKVVVDSDAEMSANQQAVIQRIGDFADATADHNYKKLCNDLLSKAARKIGGDCVKTFEQTGAQIKDFKITVNSVKVGKDGKSAVAKVMVKSNVNSTTQPQDLSLIKEDGAWRIQILGQ